MMSDLKKVLVSDPSTGTIAKASSVLQKNIKLYGPMNALDIENGTSCWNSDHGKSQSFIVDFSRLIRVHELKIQFQAGFVAETCRIEAKVNERWEVVDEVEPEDVLALQSFPLSMPPCCILKLCFNDFTDFYGRVTIYQIEVWGSERDD